LIPEFIGRLPITAVLEELAEDDLIQILTKPKNAMVKQYAKLMAMEGVELSFTDTALRELARIAVLRKTGARGLRSILEHIMLDMMYDIPLKGDVKECRITKSMVTSQLTTLGIARENRRIA
jgi:ATP-dependent Clp protease ATP-binding subunit ClpX